MTYIRAIRTRKLSAAHVSRLVATSGVRCAAHRQSAAKSRPLEDLVAAAHVNIGEGRAGRGRGRSHKFLVAASLVAAVAVPVAVLRAK